LDRLAASGAALRREGGRIGIGLGERPARVLLERGDAAVGADVDLLPVDLDELVVVGRLAARAVRVAEEGDVHLLGDLSLLLTLVAAIGLARAGLARTGLAVLRGALRRGDVRADQQGQSGNDDQRDATQHGPVSLHPWDLVPRGAASESRIERSATKRFSGQERDAIARGASPLAAGRVPGEGRTARGTTRRRRGAWGRRSGTRGSSGLRSWCGGSGATRRSGRSRRRR